MRCCPACGQTLPIEHPHGVKLTKLETRILERVRRAGKHGIRTDALFEYVYAEDPDGGPLSGSQTLRVKIHQLNRKLASRGLAVRSPRSGGKDCGTYTLRELTVEELG